MTDQPIAACSLPGPELMVRIQQWSQVVQRATSREIRGGRIISTYPRDPALVEELGRLIAAEADCCSFMKFEVTELADKVLVEVEVPEEMNFVLAAMFGMVTEEITVGSS
ncbi:MAG: hypothetical protein KY429_08340 [Actinobacteria bacterium]|nr:hypothetical protein [Actinomycetota bacterium]